MTHFMIDSFPARWGGKERRLYRLDEPRLPYLQGFGDLINLVRRETYCRIVCGPTLLVANEGVVRRAASAQRLTIAWTPERVRGCERRFRKTLSAGSRPAVSGRSAFSVTGQSGHVRSFWPFPRICTL